MVRDRLTCETTSTSPLLSIFLKVHFFLLLLARFHSSDCFLVHLLGYKPNRHTRTTDKLSSKTKPSSTLATSASLRWRSPMESPEHGHLILVGHISLHSVAFSFFSFEVDTANLTKTIKWQRDVWDFLQRSLSHDRWSHLLTRCSCTARYYLFGCTWQRWIALGGTIFLPLARRKDRFSDHS